MSKIPDGYRYTEEHEWIDPESGWMGITDHAQDELGDIVYVELPGEGDSATYLEPLLVVESVKAVSDVYSPADGQVEEVNQSVVDSPENVNDNPYEDGRFARLKVDELPEDLMDADEYRDYVS